MEWWQIKRYVRFRYTREQRKAMAGKTEMTYDLFWGCINVCYSRSDRKTLRCLLDTYPQFMRQFHDNYKRRLVEDSEFRVEQERESQRIKNLCLKEFGERWVKENWKD